MQNIIFRVTSLRGKYEDVLQGEISIAAQVSHNIPWVYEDDYKIS